MIEKWQKDYSTPAIALDYEQGNVNQRNRLHSPSPHAARIVSLMMYAI